MHYTPSKLAEIAIFHGACQKISELAPLITLLRRRKLRTIVEIGTMKGGTFWLWCQVAEPSAAIISIDLPGGKFGGGYSLKEQKKFETYGRARQRLHFLRKNSHQRPTVEQLSKLLSGKQVDFLFIDGDHTYSGVKKDFHLYSPFVRNRGLIGFHDILPHNKVRSCEVSQFWREVRLSFDHWEFADPHDHRSWGRWGGIGVLSYDCRADNRGVRRVRPAQLP